MFSVKRERKESEKGEIFNGVLPSVSFRFSAVFFCHFDDAASGYWVGSRCYPVLFSLVNCLCTPIINIFHKIRIYKSTSYNFFYYF